MLTVMMIGDVVGRPGRRMVTRYLPMLRQQLGLDLVVANGENIAHGFGLTHKTVADLFTAGVDVITGGNHTWDKKEIVEIMAQHPQVLRPLNYPQDVAGEGCWVDAQKRLAVISLMGYGDMPQVDNPLRTLENKITSLKDEGIEHIFIDFHAEYTAEKRTLCKAFEGYVSAICGTHTHVGTDDLTITSGTVYVTDIGMTGCRDNVIGVESLQPIERMRTGILSRFNVPEECPSIFQAIVMTIDDHERSAYKIKVIDDMILKSQEVSVDDQL